jgi:hypothetical protein
MKEQKSIEDLKDTSNSLQLEKKYLFTFSFPLSRCQLLAVAAECVGYLPRCCRPAGRRAACPGVAIVIAASLAAAAASSTSRDGRQLGNRWAFLFWPGACVRKFSVAWASQLETEQDGS